MSRTNLFFLEDTIVEGGVRKPGEGIEDAKQVALASQQKKAEQHADRLTMFKNLFKSK